MFFLLSREQDNRFPCHWKLGNLFLNTDQGWKIQKSSGDRIVTIYKGYANGYKLDDRVIEVQDLTDRGNFCVFSYDATADIIKVKTNRWRGFLIWKDPRFISNLVPGDYTIWNDSTIEIFSDLSISENKVDIIGDIDTETISDIESGIQELHNRLRNNISDFVKNNPGPLKVFLSGGVDSMLVYSYIKQITDEYELVDQEHVEWDYFFCNWQNRIKKQFWGYKQIHHWRTPSVLSSGAPGDEFMLRSPTTADLWLRYHGSSIPDLMQSLGDIEYSHKKYFAKYQNIFDEHAHSADVQRSLNLPREEFYRYLANIIVNDCQHWHLGNTLTFTPLRDLDMFLWFVRLPVEVAGGQISCSDISRRLIALNDPDLLNYLSPVKNTGESLSNVWSLISKHAAVSGQ